MKSAALFILALTPAIAFADVLPPYKRWPDTCESYKKEGDAASRTEASRANAAFSPSASETASSCLRCGAAA